MASITTPDELFAALNTYLDQVWDNNPMFLKPRYLLAMDVDKNYVVVEDNKTITTIISTLDSGRPVIYKTNSSKCIVTDIGGNVKGYLCEGKLSISSCPSVDTGNSEPVEILASSLLRPTFDQYMSLLDSMK